MEALQEGHNRMAERCTEVAEKYLPEGWTVVYRRNLTGRCFYRRSELAATRPVTRRALHIFFHECAHAVLHLPKKRHAAAPGGVRSGEGGLCQNA